MDSVSSSVMSNGLIDSRPGFSHFSICLSSELRDKCDMSGNSYSNM